MHPTKPTHPAHPAGSGLPGAPEVPGYVLGRLLGRGATGAVWSGSAVDGGRAVAVKVLGGTLDEVTSAAARQLEVGRRVSSEHLVRARDRVDLPDGSLALVLDLAAGGSLHEVVAARGRLPVGEVVTVVTPLATTLAALHAAGVVHADLSPGNVLFSASGRPLLSDLTSARLVADPEPYALVGTPGFTAPEVLAGGLPTPASDVWALGALLWYACTGGSEPPAWVGWTRRPRSARTCDGPADPELEDVVAAVGPELQGVLLRMLASDPEARPTAAAAAVAAYRAAEPQPVQLVRHEVDLASAVTHRLRREAAETRSRAELREAHRVQQRHRRRERWVARALPARVRAEPAEATPARRPTDGAATFSSAIGGLAGSPWRRLALVCLAGLLLAASVVGSLRFTGSSSGARPDTVPLAVTSAGVTPVADGLAARSVVPQGRQSLTADPAGVLQRLADLRAVALESADAAALTSAESPGSPAQASDRAVTVQLQDTGQRYTGLAFRVRSAEVRAMSDATATLAAVIDRESYTLVDRDGTRHEVTAAAGDQLSYQLALVDGGWRLAAISVG